jgi:hypothetical protein
MGQQKYRFVGQVVAVGDAKFTSCLGKAHSSGERPFCMCKEDGDGVEVYVARRHEKFVVHRMPNTGPDHAPWCDHYEPADDLTGLGQLKGSAIVEDEESGETTIKLGFSLSRGPARLAMQTTDEDKPSVKTDGLKLSIRGFLHYLWNEAQLTHWHPRMEGKRSWNVIRNALLHAAERKSTKGHYLPSMLYIPETFLVKEKFEIDARRREWTARAISGTRQLMLVIAEFKSFEVGVNGKRIICKHLPDWGLKMDEILAKRVHRNFEAMFDLIENNPGSRVIVCATFEVANNYPKLFEVTFMPVTDEWIPFESLNELALVTTCISERRHFVKGMRMNLANHVPIASVILTDTKPLATAVYLKVDAPSGDHTAILEQHMAQTGVDHCVYGMRRERGEKASALPSPAWNAAGSSRAAVRPEPKAETRKADAPQGDSAVSPVYAAVKSGAEAASGTAIASAPRKAERPSLTSGEDDKSSSVNFSDVRRHRLPE